MSTAEEILDGVDLTGRVAVVTGGTGGVGLATARALAARHAHVVIAGRDRQKGAAALDAIGDDGAEFVDLDLADLASVHRCADLLAERHPAISLLINNAGVMATPLRRTADGFELQFATNHLGPYALTGRLTEALIAGAPARVVNVTSGGPVLVPFRWHDPNFAQDEYDKFEAYGNSKTATLLHAIELDRRLAVHGVRAFAANPGLTATDLGRHLAREDIRTLMRRARANRGEGSLFPHPAEQGAATVVWAATSKDLDGLGGLMCSDCAVVEPPPAVLADDAPQRLWALSAELTGDGANR